jgi:hypothetical protein
MLDDVFDLPSMEEDDEENRITVNMIFPQYRYLCGFVCRQRSTRLTIRWL